MFFGILYVSWISPWRWRTLHVGFNFLTFFFFEFYSLALQSSTLSNLFLSLSGTSKMLNSTLWASSACNNQKWDCFLNSPVLIVLVLQFPLTFFEILFAVPASTFSHGSLSFTNVVFGLCLFIVLHYPRLQLARPFQFSWICYFHHNNSLSIAYYISSNKILTRRCTIQHNIFWDLVILLSFYPCVFYLTGLPKLVSTAVFAAVSYTA